MSLALYIQHSLCKHGQVLTHRADGVAGDIVGKTERTVRDWRLSFSEAGALSESSRGKYQRPLLWLDEDLNAKVRTYVRAYGCVKGKPNMTLHSFCDWVNTDQLPSSTLGPQFPRHACLETCRTWLLELGFEIVERKKGVYVHNDLSYAL